MRWQFCGAGKVAVLVSSTMDGCAVARSSADCLVTVQLHVGTANLKALGSADCLREQDEQLRDTFFRFYCGGGIDSLAGAEVAGDARALGS